MLPKRRRISRKEFPTILSHGKRYNSPFLLLYIAKRDQENMPKNMAENSLFAFSASKKVSKTAVGRNKLRRQGYSIVQKHLTEIKPGYFLFFSFKKAGIGPQSFAVLEQ